jgi:hypothetical protein
MLKNYPIIQPPFTLIFHEMSKQELKDYYDWFMAQREVRIAILCEAVNEPHISKPWRADGSVESLGYLGEWLLKHVTTRKNGADESKEVTFSNGFTIQVQDWTLTNQSYSLAYDAAFYFSKVMQQNLPFLKWTVHLKNKKHVDYGQPALQGNNQMALEPLRIMTVLMFSYAKGSREAAGLKELYYIWEEVLSKPNP